ncbi:nucleoside triphosphate pyrophosphohydrolase [uncultured Dysosmobacter sp.]|uniref:nucleoside triphosphate pyrophosphohydrolase n=1 Tax=uncultured Dysosmobacter sp. TaxID=2591384 RepID=UPI00263875AE|nr:nucleoside triphosphate pyrophosphohydrolase [uncultured Dysosmobacter sp.]
MVDFQYKPHYDWEDFLEIMRVLREPGGCPWDAEQTHESIRRNFLEETYEVLDALDRDDPHAMCEELGDVLMQIVFHAQIEAERGRFTMADVVDGVAQKMVYRHPHVFGGTMQADNSEQVLANWEVLKRQEKGQRSTADAIESVPHTLPALWRAEKIASKTAKAGFDWDSAISALGKLEEEVRELRKALESGREADAPHGVREEVGDALFITGKIAQMSGVDPEDALHRACDKFERRFRQVESSADKPLSDYTEAELVALWRAAKEMQS